MVTSALVTTLTAITAQIRALEAEIAAQLDAHPDAHVFTSLPRSGTLRAARLLAEIGDCRSRFPDPESLQGLAGVAPVTRQSGCAAERDIAQEPGVRYRRILQLQPHCRCSPQG